MCLKISMGVFREEVKGYDKFTLSHDDIFSAAGFELSFDRVVVVLSASPHIKLRNNDSVVSLRHICSITELDSSSPEKTFLLSCYNYDGGRKVPDGFVLSCTKAS